MMTLDTSELAYYVRVQKAGCELLLKDIQGNSQQLVKHIEPFVFPESIWFLVLHAVWLIEGASNRHE